MSDKKISQLTASATPLAGTEVLPIVKSGATVKVAVSDLTAGRAVSATDYTATTGAPGFSIPNQGTGPARAQYANTGGTLYIGLDSSTGGLTLPYAFNVYHTGAYPICLSTNGATKLTVEGSSSDVTVNTGNLVINTAGKGIDFSADGQAAGMTSELLDDYEEGTWTPEYKGSGGDPTVAYTTQIGTYTKIGRYVYFQLNLSVNTTSGGSGNLSISGLPFTSAASSLAVGGCVNTWTSVFAAWTTNAPNGGHIPSSGTSILLNYSAATDTPQIGVANLTNGCELNMQGFYQV